MTQIREAEGWRNGSRNRLLTCRPSGRGSSSLSPSAKVRWRVALNGRQRSRKPRHVRDGVTEFDSLALLQSFVTTVKAADLKAVKSMMRQKHIEAPLTSEQLKEKILGKGKKKKATIVLPVAAEGSHFGGDRATAKFTHTEFGGVFSFTASEGVDGNGKVHKFPGGMGFRFNWVAEGVGFGEFQLKLRTDGVLEIDAETLGKEFFKRALCALVDSAKDKHEKVN